ncbi:MAG: TetR/AcrR family transcriptional regulator [Halieaceae bacterium]|uniref:TetR/AcrR family transcriptional regulator n=1 Tax=Haliea alexandrii TaxID=2448162 RepID=UPI000F0B4BF0|nr:TetR/AcrR family transcriptional regulator [Haliea alexandrii]MCR9183908.1 TetR/AcrR family transcriptional regulator [Halieaceae bacterium]
MEQTQERLLNVSAQLFSKQGFTGVSMRDIARDVGITQAAIYHHFSSKEALYIATVTYLFEQQTLGISEKMAAIDDPAQRLKLLVSAMMEATAEDPRFRRIYMRELLEGDEKKLKAIAQSAFTAFYEPLYALMGELAPNTNPQLLIFSMTGMIFHHLDARKLAPHLPHTAEGATAIPSLAEHITNLILHGVTSS